MKGIKHSENMLCLRLSNFREDTLTKMANAFQLENFIGSNLF